MTVLTIQVKPSSSKDEITMDENGHLLVKIRERPIDGAANKYLIQFLSDAFNIRKNCISLEKGSTSRFKKISFDIDQEILNTIIQRFKK